MSQGSNLRDLNPNLKNAVDDINKASSSTTETSSGSSRSSVSSADRAKASKQITSAQTSGFITVSSGFAKLASSLGIKISTSNNKNSKKK